MALPLAFDTQGLPVVNAIIQGGGGLPAIVTITAPLGPGAPSTGVRTTQTQEPVADAGNSSAVPLAGGAMFTGVVRDMLDYPAIMVDCFTTWAANTDGKGAVLRVTWSDDPLPLANGYCEPELINCGRGNGALGNGHYALLNRKARYVIVSLSNRSADAMAALRLVTSLLSQSVEEVKSDATEGAGKGVTLAMVDNAVHTTGLQEGQRYRVSVVGGEGICIRCDGTVATTGDEPWYDGQKFTFHCHRGANGISAIKRVAGTANASVVIVPLDDLEET